MCSTSMFSVGNPTSVVNPLHVPEILCNAIMRANYKVGLLFPTVEYYVCFFFFAGKTHGAKTYGKCHCHVSDVKSYKMLWTFFFQFML